MVNGGNFGFLAGARSWTVMERIGVREAIKLGSVKV